MDIKDLRILLGQRTTAATKKISRIKSNTGAVVSGTNFDPRIPRSSFKKLNRRQLEVALKRVNDFVSRETQFVGLMDKTPLPRKTWVDFQAAREKQNQIANSVFDKIKDVKHPTQSSTVGQARAQRIPTSHPSAGNPSVNLDFGAPKISPGDVTSERAFKVLSKDAKRKSTTKYARAAIRAARLNFKLIESGGMVHLNDRIRKLSDNQFMALWSIKEFVDAQAIKYATLQDAGGVDEVSENQWDVMRTADEEIEKFVNWAEKLKFGE